jgi:glyoxylase-like metal-dependent hydrolase (beta-lactamase superfamily II)
MTQAVVLPAGVRVFERGWLSANNILLFGEGPSALIDSGYWTHAAHTVSLVRHALAGESLELLLNTHLHSDHCGGNAALQEEFPGIQTLVPPGQAALVQNWDPDSLTYVATGQHCPRFRLDAHLVPGTEMQLGDLVWEIHAAPGHDQHSVILFQPTSSILVSADALWQNGFGVVFQELEGERAFEEVGATIDLIESLRPSLVIPGHGAIFTEVDAAVRNARRRLESFITDPQRHMRHAAKVLLKFKLLERGEMSIVELITWAESTRYLSAVHARNFADITMSLWIEKLIDELVQIGAAVRNDGSLKNP